MEDLRKTISESRAALLKVCSERIRPGLDDKILTSWNALMTKGYIDAYKAFGEERSLDRALKNAEFLLANAVQVKNGIYRNYKNGKSTIHGFLDDYAYVLSSFIALYQATFDEAWLQHANGLMVYTLEHFFDKESGMFFYTHDKHSNLI